MRSTGRKRRVWGTRKRAHHGGAQRSIDIRVPDEFYRPLYDLLWLDRPAKNIKLNVSRDPGIVMLMKEIAQQMGATDEILTTQCYAICGPSGVGKTKFINRIKEKYHAEVINMDTMQVYNSISVGTGRTNLANSAGAHLYGVYDTNTQFHILDYINDVIKVVKTINNRRNPIIFEGASKSLIDAIRCIFPNLVIFGIEAVNEDNIKENIVKRITVPVVKRVILELSKSLKDRSIAYNSSVLQNNPEVYAPLMAVFSEEELIDEHIVEKLNADYPDRINSLTKHIINKNIELHRMQHARLKTIPDILWFTNDTPSVERLDSVFQSHITRPRSTKPESILTTSANFDFINTADCASHIKSPSRELCAEIDTIYHSGDPSIPIEFAARLNVPLIPKRGAKQIVIGTTKYLLPYALLPEYFNMFAIKADAWTIDNNMYLIECIANKFIDSDIIRIITTPNDLIDRENNYRITAKEICILKTYGYNFYKYNSKEFTNVYFCSRAALSGCLPVEPSQGAFRCNGDDLGPYLYF